MDNIITKNRSPIPLDLNIILAPYIFSLQAAIDHHGNSIHCGHYTASVNCCGKTLYCNDDRITQCNPIDTCNSSTVYILLYKLIVGCPWPDHGGGSHLTPMGLARFSIPLIKGRGTGTKTCGLGPGVRQCVPPWWPLDWFGYLREPYIDIWFTFKTLTDGVCHLLYLYWLMGKGVAYGGLPNRQFIYFIHYDTKVSHIT